MSENPIDERLEFLAGSCMDPVDAQAMREAAVELRRLAAAVQDTTGTLQNYENALLTLTGPEFGFRAQQYAKSALGARYVPV